MNFTRPVLIAMIQFKGADVWGPDGYERFHWDHPLKLLEDYMEHDSLLKHSRDPVGFLRENPTWWTFTAYRRQGPIGESERASWAETMAEKLRENFAEEYGDYDDGDDGLTDTHVAELKSKTRAIVDWYLARAKVFPCEQLRSFRLDSDDILELVEQLRPEWLAPGVKP